MMVKKLEWVGSSKKDLLEFTEEIRRFMGYVLYAAQLGKKVSSTKILKGFGGGQVIEIIDMDDSGTYRTVYTVKFEDAIYVLHAFQKKSKSGIKTPTQEINLIKSRLKLAQEISKLKKKIRIKMKDKKIQESKLPDLEYETSSGNVFEDLAIENPEEALLKAELALQINEIISKKKLTQKSAATLLGVDQPKVSALMNGKLSGFSIERLFRFLNDLGQEITINIHPADPLLKVSMKRRIKLNVPDSHPLSCKEIKTIR